MLAGETMRAIKTTASTYALFFISVYERAGNPNSLP